MRTEKPGEIYIFPAKTAVILKPERKMRPLRRVAAVKCQRLIAGVTYPPHFEQPVEKPVEYQAVAATA